MYNPYNTNYNYNYNPYIPSNINNNGYTGYNVPTTTVSNNI